MPTLREFSAWITSEGKPLREYLVAIDPNTSKASCWIPSEAGKGFSVHWRDEGSRVHSCSFISLDGHTVPGRFLYGYGEAWRNGVRTGSNTERPFMFMEQTTTFSGGQNNPDAGTISLKIRRVAIEGSRSANALQQVPEPSGSWSMSSHCISYGEQRQTYEQCQETWNVKSYDESGNRSYVTFVFRYRPLEFLLSQGIMNVEDAPHVPPAVRKACAMNRRVVSAPLPGGGPMLMTPSPTPSAQTRDNSEQVGSAPQNAFNRGNVDIRRVNHLRTVSATAPSRQGLYPGEIILDLNVRPSMLRM